MQIQWKTIRLKIDWLMILFPLVAAALGEGRSTAALLLSLTAHESAHLLAARLAHVPIREIRITPFGGMAQIDNLYLIDAARLAAVSIAGPAANLLLVFVSAALCHWMLLNAAAALTFIQINAMLMLFNLLPALPLDGGRILYAGLSRLTGRRRAMTIGIWTGRGLAVLLILLSLYGFLRSRTLNLSPIFAALFLLASAQDEQRALGDSIAANLVHSLRPISNPTPASIIAIDEKCTPEPALRACVPGRVNLFAVFKDNRFIRLTDEQTLINQMLHPPTP